MKSVKLLWAPPKSETWSYKSLMRDIRLVCIPVQIFAYLPKSGEWAAFGCICLICPGQMAFPSNPIDSSILNSMHFELELTSAIIGLTRVLAKVISGISTLTNLQKPFPSNLSKLVLPCILRWLACLWKLSIRKTNTTHFFAKHSATTTSASSTTDLQMLMFFPALCLFSDLTKSYPHWVIWWSGSLKLHILHGCYS